MDRSPPKFLLAALCAGLLAAPTASARLERPATRIAVAHSAPAQIPDQAYPVLFAAVQRAELFDDQKTFADARPRRDPQAIQADYLAQRERPGFDLRSFVERNFDLPLPTAAKDVRKGATLRAHIDGLWPALTRTDPAPQPHDSRLTLPRPYVVPGGRFREMYYWDSYFTLLGLVESGERTLARQMVDDFAYLIDTYGHVPNGARTYYLSRSQPPFFSHMVELLARVEGDDAVRRYLPQLRREHEWWMQGARVLQPGEATRHVVRLDDGALLNRYWDERDTPRPESWLHDVRTAAVVPQRPATEVHRDLRASAESGWDHSSRWLDDRAMLGTIRTTAFVPVDLNSLLHHLETTIARACARAGDAPCSNRFDEQARARASAIERHLWNANGYYADYDFRRGELSTQVTAATLYPLFAGIASPQRARLTAITVRTQLLRPGGLVATTLHTGQQWDAPNAWAPLQWIAVDGLRRYGEEELARDIAHRFLARVEDTFQREGRLVEKYDAESIGRGGGGGEYPLQDGFGWTNGVVRRLLVLYPAQVEPAPL